MSGTGEEPVDGSAVSDSTLTNVDVAGAEVLSATVVGDAVVGATVGGATVSGAEVLGAAVVGVTVVGGSVVGAMVVDGTAVVVEAGQAGMLAEAGHEGPAELIWAVPRMMPAARPRPAMAARPGGRPCRFRAWVLFMIPA